MVLRLGVLAIVLLAFSPAAGARTTIAAKKAVVRHYGIVITGSTHTDRIDMGNGPQNDGELVEDLTWTARWNHVSLKVSSSSFGDAISLIGPRATFTSHFSFRDSYQVEGGPCTGTVNSQLPGKVVILGSAFVALPHARSFHFSAQVDGFEGITPDVYAETRAACKGHTLFGPDWVTGDKKLAGGVVAHEPTAFLLNVNFDGHNSNRVGDIIRTLAHGHALLLSSGDVSGTVSRVCPGTCTNSSRAIIKMKFIPG